jgi:molecular chaperone GrpE
MNSKAEEGLVTTEVASEGKNGDSQPQEGSATSSENAESPLAESSEPSAVDPLAALQSEVARWKDLALRSQAELDNFRKRMAREKADAIRFGNAALLESLLPVVDNFRFGLEAAKREAGPSVVVDGMSMVYKQLNDFLEQAGVQEVEAEGKPFDPNLHDAVQEASSQEVEAGHVLSVVRRGFRLYDRLLRPANVIVSRGPVVEVAEPAAVEQQPGSEEPLASPNE